MRLQNAGVSMVTQNIDVSIISVLHLDDISVM